MSTHEVCVDAQTTLIINKAKTIMCVHLYKTECHNFLISIQVLTLS